MKYRSLRTCKNSFLLMKEVDFIELLQTVNLIRLFKKRVDFHKFLVLSISVQSITKSQSSLTLGKFLIPSDYWRYDFTNLNIRMTSMQNCLYRPIDQKTEFIFLETVKFRSFKKNVDFAVWKRFISIWYKPNKAISPVWWKRIDLVQSWFKKSISQNYWKELTLILF